jgi:hypothetical protein
MIEYVFHQTQRDEDEGNRPLQLRLFLSGLAICALVLVGMALIVL